MSGRSKISVGAYGFILAMLAAMAAAIAYLSPPLQTRMASQSAPACTSPDQRDCIASRETTVVNTGSWSDGVTGTQYSLDTQEGSYSIDQDFYQAVHKSDAIQLRYYNGDLIEIVHDKSTTDMDPYGNSIGRRCILLYFVLNILVGSIGAAAAQKVSGDYAIAGVIASAFPGVFVALLAGMIASGLQTPTAIIAIGAMLVVAEGAIWSLVIKDN